MGAAILLFGATLRSGAQVEPGDPKKRFVKVELAPFEHREYSGRFVADKRSIAIALGGNRSNLALYVFDAHGNCVGRDDDLSLISRDDLAAEWIPAQTGPISIQVKSLARVANVVTMVVRQD